MNIHAQNNKNYSKVFDFLVFISASYFNCISLGRQINSIWLLCNIHWLLLSDIFQRKPKKFRHICALLCIFHTSGYWNKLFLVETSDIIQDGCIASKFNDVWAFMGFLLVVHWLYWPNFFSAFSIGMVYSGGIGSSNKSKRLRPVHAPYLISKKYPFIKRAVKHCHSWREYKAHLIWIVPLIDTPWDEWETLYYTLPRIPGHEDLVLDGLAATLSSCTLRALASGKAEREGKKWRITVSRIAVFVHDIFNFEKSEGWKPDYLGCWDCGNKEFYRFNPSVPCLDNSVFRDFRILFNTGVEFLVLSTPHDVANFAGEPYVYPA